MTHPRQPAVHILASQRNGTLYIGVARKLIGHIWQHRKNVVKGFTNRYGVRLLVYYERHQTMESAILRQEKNN